MNKKYFIFLIVVLSGVLGYFVIKTNGESAAYVNNKTGDKENESETYFSKDIDDILDNMTLEEKIGQMLVINFQDSEVTEELRNLFLTVKPGGIILMKDNFTTFDNTKKLVDDLKDLSSIPLIVSVDQEGGRVQRLQFLTDVNPTYIPDMLSVGNMNDEKLAYDIGKIMASEVRTLGINVVNAPVVDIFSNPLNTVIGNRSFGSDKSVVTKMSLNLAQGLEDNGVIPTFKHFPGHGDTETDSHKKLPIIEKSYEEFYNLELVPFKAAIKSGAKLIMTAHIALPNVTGNNEPASLSKKMITDILRNDLGYKGLVITDALNMKALTDNYSNEEIYLKALEAGVDILLMPKDVNLAVEVIKNNFSEERINESVKKILEFKYEYFNNYTYTDKSVLGCEEHLNIVSKVDFER